VTPKNQVASLTYRASIMKKRIGQAPGWRPLTGVNPLPAKSGGAAMKYAVGVLAALIALPPTVVSAQTTSNERPTADESIQRAASLALAPPAPRVTDDRGRPLLARDPSGYDASLRWTASPNSVAYRVYWRDAWSRDWQHSQTVGNVTHFVLQDVSIDDFVFGVSAIGPDGHESLISAYTSLDLPVPPVKLAN
jgi:hypothetical protein